MAECGQPPVSTPDHAIGRQRALADQKFGVFARVDVVGDHGQVHRRPQALAQHVNQRGLPAAHWSGDANSKCAMSVIVAHNSKEEIALRQRQNAGRLAGQQLAVGANFVGFRIHFDCGVAELWIISAFPIFRQFCTGTSRLLEARASRHAAARRAKRT